MFETREYRLQSTREIHTPGIIRWAQHSYQFSESQEKMVEIVSDGYGLPEPVTRSLLSGDIAYRVEGEDVVFEVEVEDAAVATV